jgi:hypothetical protein
MRGGLLPGQEDARHRATRQPFAGKTDDTGNSLPLIGSTISGGSSSPPDTTVTDSVAATPPAFERLTLLAPGVFSRGRE